MDPHKRELRYSLAIVEHPRTLTDSERARMRALLGEYRAHHSMSRTAPHRNQPMSSKPPLSPGAEPWDQMPIAIVQIPEYIAFALLIYVMLTISIKQG